MEFVNGLPEFCFQTNSMNDEVILIKRGESGYHRYYSGTIKGKEAAKELNRRMGITPAQAEAMLVGSMFGWHVPGADPEMYDEEGKPVERSTSRRQGKPSMKARELSYAEGMRDEHY